MSEPTLYRIEYRKPNEPDTFVSILQDGGLLVPVEPEHQHQWLPWLTLPNGSSWTQCTGCGEQFQYDH